MSVGRIDSAKRSCRGAAADDPRAQRDGGFHRRALGQDRGGDKPGSVENRASTHRQKEIGALALDYLHGLEERFIRRIGLDAAEFQGRSTEAVGMIGIEWSAP